MKPTKPKMWIKTENIATKSKLEVGFIIIIKRRGEGGEEEIEITK